EDAVVVAPEQAGRERSLVAYVVPDARSALPVCNLLKMERAGEFAGHARYELPNGMPIIHRNPSETGFVFREIFEEHSYLRHGVTLKPGDCVFDVGANIGLFTLFASQFAEG